MGKQVVILGATGSIGTQAFSLREELDLDIIGLSAAENWERLLEQALIARPAYLHLEMQSAADKLAQALQELSAKIDGYSPTILRGESGLAELAKTPCDTILIAISGFRAMTALAVAIEAKQRIALANKEAIVCAGQIFMPEIRQKAIDLIPVDSEHSAIWQAKQARGAGDIAKVYLTASGGPFRGKRRSQLQAVKKAEALAHPNWSMGQKITIDSATLVNKGLELIEAVQLFDLYPSQVEVVIHPQSFIHSMVGFADGSIVAQASPPDMRLPIQLAFTWPERVKGPVQLVNMAEDFPVLNFTAVDNETFPGVQLALDALNRGHFGPTIFNAANEIAVSAFLADEIGFLEIYRIIEESLAKTSKLSQDLVLEGTTQEKISAIIEADSRSRDFAKTLI